MASTTETVIRISAKDETSRAFNSVNANMRRTNKTMTETTKQLRFMRGGFGQVGHQVQDIAVQLQMGQNAMLIFGQQGSQIASLFGPHGAIIGAVLAVGAALGTALMPALFDSKDATEELEEAQKSLNKIFKASKDGTFGLTEEYIALTKAARGLADLQMAGAMIDANTAVEASLASMLASLDEAISGWFIFGADVDYAIKTLRELDKTVEESARRMTRGQVSVVAYAAGVGEALKSIENKFGVSTEEAALLLDTIAQITEETTSADLNSLAEGLNNVKGNDVFKKYLSDLAVLIVQTEKQTKQFRELEKASFMSSAGDQGLKDALKPKLDANKEFYLNQKREKEAKEALDASTTQNRLDSAQALAKEIIKQDKEEKKILDRKVKDAAALAKAEKKASDQAFQDRSLTMASLQEEADRLEEDTKKSEELHARKSISAEAAAQRVIIAAMSEMDQVNRLAEDARSKIESDRELGLLGETTYKESLLAIESKHLADINAIKVEAAEKAQQLRDDEIRKETELMEAKKAIGNETIQSAKGVFASLSDGMDKGSAAQKAMFAIEKALAIASIIMNTQKAGIAAAANDAALGGFLGFMASKTAVEAVGYASAGVVAGQTLASFEGGGFTGNGIRAGGMDGKGGKLAMLHPNEKVTDLTMGGEASSVNVTFNIQANDTKGFDQLLASRRGTIVGLINQAMNNRGKAGVV